MSGATAILGATGACGIHLVRALTARGEAVRAVSRNQARLESLFGDSGAELRALDLSRHSAAPEALEGCSRAFLCVGLPLEQMHVHPVIAEYVAKAAERGGVRVVHLSSCWSYLPLQRGVLDETHPREGGAPFVQYRRDAEDILQRAGAAVLNLPDFFGPELEGGVVQQSLQKVIRNGRLEWIGAADNERDFLYVPDAVQIALAVSAQEAACGQRFVVPGSGPITGRQLAALLGELEGRRVHLRTLSPVTLRLMSLFSEELRAFLSLVPDYARSMRCDGSRLESLLGEFPRADYRSALETTLGWLRARQKDR